MRLTKLPNKIAPNKSLESAETPRGTSNYYNNSTHFKHQMTTSIDLNFHNNEIPMPTNINLDTKFGLTTYSSRSNMTQSQSESAVQDT